MTTLQLILLPDGKNVIAPKGEAITELQLARLMQALEQGVRFIILKEPVEVVDLRDSA